VTTAVSTGCYVFGIVPAGSPLPDSDAEGLASGLALVESGDMAALVGHVPTDRPLGRAADLRAHDRVVADVVTSGTPILPMRFGAVVADEDAVRDELLVPHRAEFEDALGTLAGRVQYTVRAEYEQETVLRQLLSSRPDIRALRDRANSDPSAQIRLGELVVHALEQLRPADASAILSELIGTVDLHVREPSNPEEVLHAAFLVDVSRAPDFERRVEKAAAQRAGRLRFRLVGPSAAYDFVGDA
jgi:Gas vesicle synthesis protein GvpL/GvpF